MFSHMLLASLLIPVPNSHLAQNLINRGTGQGEVWRLDFAMQNVKDRSREGFQRDRGQQV